MPRSLILIALSVLVVGLGGGCADRFVERTLVPPADQDAGACLDRCQLQVDECQGRQVTRATECETQRAAAQSDYELCIEGGGGDCQRPDACASADMGICDQIYEMCFVACGGRVEQGWRSRPWEAPEAPATPVTPATGVPAAEGLDGPEHAEG
jgi:hypothetical protein